MSESKNYNPPSGTPGDTAHLVTRTLIGLVPAIGGSFKEMFNAIISPPLERRKSAWMELIGKAISELEGKAKKLEDLSNDDGFVDTVIRASQIALATSQEEKLNALKNAILNSALPEAPDQSLRQLFLNYMDSFTEWHFRLLSLSYEPVEFFKDKPGKINDVAGGSFSMIIWRAYPELATMEEFVKAVWTDLYSKGLVSQESLNVFASNPMNKKTTKLGDQLLKFIKQN